jgi:hypothetical protein
MLLPIPGKKAAAHHGRASAGIKQRKAGSK